MRLSGAFRQALVFGPEPSIKMLTMRLTALKGTPLQVPENNAVNSHESLCLASLISQVETD